MSARDDILSRVRHALGDSEAEPPPIPRDYRRTGTLSAVERLDLLADRLLDYRALVRRCSPSRLDDEVAGALAARGVNRIVVPPGLSLSWPAAVDVVVDDGRLTSPELARMDGVVTAATLAIAETGTIVLDGSADQGRRAISLVPDFHLCVVHASQVVELVPEAMTRLEPERPLTWISGPSATSDIELSRVEGVHGPRTLEVVIVDDEPQ